MSGALFKAMPQGVLALKASTTLLLCLKLFEKRTALRTTASSPPWVGGMNRWQHPNMNDCGKRSAHTVQAR